MPSRVGRFIVGLEFYGVIVVSALLLVGVVRCYDGREQAAQANVTRAYENGYKAAMLSVANKQAKTDTVVQVVRVQSARVDTVLVIADSVLADSSASIDVLRGTLSLLRTEVVAYRGTVDSLLIAIGEERLAAQLAQQSAQRLIGQLKAEVRAEQGRRWRYRGEGAGLALGGVLLLLLL